MDHNRKLSSAQSTNTSSPDITIVYEHVADLEERIADMQCALRAKIHAMKSQLAYLERSNDNFDAMGRQAIDMLQDEGVMKKMVAEKGKKMNKLAEFIQRAEAMLRQLSVEVDDEQVAEQEKREEQGWSDGGSIVAQTELTDPFV